MNEIDAYISCNHSTTGAEEPLAETWRVVLAIFIFLSAMPFFFASIPPLPLEMTCAVLIGALLTVGTTILSFDDTYEITKATENMQEILLLIGLMLLMKYFQRELIFQRFIHWILPDDLRFEKYIWRVTMLCSVSAALFTSNAVCLILTPILLSHWKQERRSNVEAETLLLGIITSAHIGSLLSVYGNSPIAIIASVTNLKLPEHKLTLINCLSYMALPTLVAYCLNLGFLILHHRLRRPVKNYLQRNGLYIRYPKSRRILSEYKEIEGENVPFKPEDNALDHEDNNREANPENEQSPKQECDTVQNTGELEHGQNEFETYDASGESLAYSTACSSIGRAASSVGYDGGISRSCTDGPDTEWTDMSAVHDSKHAKNKAIQGSHKDPTNSKALHIFLGVLVVLMVIMFWVGSEVVHFDIGRYKQSRQTFC